MVSNLHEILGRARGWRGLQGLHDSQGSQGLLSHGSDTPETSPGPGPGPGPGENLALDDAENPLQLLARASDLKLSGQETQDAVASGTDRGTHPAKPFFVPVRASRDIGPDLDPIDLGLATADETEMLFSLYVDT